MACMGGSVSMGHSTCGAEMRTAEMGRTDMGHAEMRSARVWSAEVRPAAMPATPTGMAAGMAATWLGGEACPGRQT